MKKSSIFIAVCGVLIILCAITASLAAGKIFHKEPEAEISTEEARNIALQDAGADLEDVTFTRKALEKENDRQIYLIEFYNDEASWKYRIDGLTGSISRRDEKTVIDTSEKAGSDETARPAAATSLNTEAETFKEDGSDPSTGMVKEDGSDPSTGMVKEVGSDPSTGTVKEDAMNYIGVKKAQEIALKDAGLKTDQVIFEKSDLDHDFNKAVYEIEFKTDRMEYEYEIDAMSGSIIDKDMDKD